MGQQTYQQVCIDALVHVSACLCVLAMSFGMCMCAFACASVSQCQDVLTHAAHTEHITHAQPNEIAGAAGSSVAAQAAAAPPQGCTHGQACGHAHCTSEL